jgi:serine phosphatase RsbU (regulator of sigma subunit)
LLALMAHSMLSTFDNLVYTSPGVLLSGLNSFLYNRMAGNFLTAFYACIDTEKNTITYSNAGHPFPYFKKKNEDHFTELNTKGKLIGVMLQLIYEENTIPFNEGDKLILYTDGLLETSMNGYKIEQEENRFMDNLIEICKTSSSPKQIIQSTIKSIKSFPGFQGFQDDVTYLIIERK